LGILLEVLHEECDAAMQKAATDSDQTASPVSERSASVDSVWLEVGPKQKPAITRTSGHTITDSPISRIFGGKLRSELRVPGMKNSITLEAYRPLQLDIGAPNVNNIVDALKGLTRSETLQGDFQSPRGAGIPAHKQVFIETLPPVLILHLKRFQYDNTGGVQKIWKKVGYPLELTIPKEVFPQQKRAALSLGGLPKYRLSAVVYHHGNNAATGHYTVDVRRQDGLEWIRLNDTVIRRLRAEAVAEAGAEEDPRVLAKALEQHKRELSTGGVSRNPYEHIDEAEEQADQEKGWKQVNGSGSGKESLSSSTARKWNAVVNGATSPSSAGRSTPKKDKDGFKENKVAYLLFYRKVE
jgi:ubiquitin carboxyl-terminal hydrolase 10